MASYAMRSVSTKVKLNDGTDTQGRDKYVTINLPNQSEEYFGNSKSDFGDKTLAIITALAPCLSKTVSSVEVASAETLTAA